MLWHVHGSPSTRLLWLCAELDLLHVVRVHHVQPDDDVPAQLADAGVSPLALQQGDLCLAESMAACLHLLEVCDSELMPALDSPERTTLFQLVFWTASTLDPLIDATLNAQQRGEE